jgi:hypothetical protein
MKNAFIIAISTVTAVFVLHWATLANEGTEKNDSAPSSLKEAEIQYAEISERAAEAELAGWKMFATDHHVGPMPTSGVMLKKSWIAYLKDPTNESPLEVAAKIWLENAQKSLETARKLNDLAPTTETKIDLTRHEFKAEMAKAKLEVAKQLRNASLEDKVQWLTINLSDTNSY